MKSKPQKRKLKYLFILFLILTVATAIAILKNINQKQILCDDCNVILIGIDTLRADRVGYHNYERKLTPTFDSLAEDSYVFENAVTQASWTLPSFMSLFTSTYPSQHKITNKFYINDKGNLSISDLRLLSPHIRTLAEILSEGGYKTAGFTGDAGVSSEFGFGKGFEVYYDAKSFGGFNTSFSLAESWISDNRDNRFFVFIHGYDCHGDFEIDEGKRLYSNGSRSNYTGSREEEVGLRERGLAEGSLNLSETDLHFWKNLYDDKVLNMDRQLSGFIQYLEKEGLMNNTVIVVVSDHGEELLEHGRIDHGATLYDEVIRVVFTIRTPEPDKRMIRDQVRLIDLMPTLLDVLDIEPNEQLQGQMQGTNLMPLLLGRSLNLDAVSETDYRYYVSKKSIRTNDDWKFIIDSSSGHEELFHLETDPDEKNNLLVSNKDKAEELKEKIYDCLSKEGIKESDSTLFLESRDLDRFTLIESINLEEKELLYLVADDEHLKVEKHANIDLESSERLVERDILLINGLFSNSISPYPGEISNEIECAEEFKPIFFETGIGGRRYLTTYSNDRFGIGACSDDLLAYRFLMGWIYCPTVSELYSIRYFVPLEREPEELAEFFVNLKCMD